MHVSGERTFQAEGRVCGSVLGRESVWHGGGSVRLPGRPEPRKPGGASRWLQGLWLFLRCTGESQRMV